MMKSKMNSVGYTIFFSERTMDEHNHGLIIAVRKERFKVHLFILFNLIINWRLNHTKRSTSTSKKMLCSIEEISVRAGQYGIIRNEFIKKSQII